MISLEAFRYLKRTIRAFHKMFKPIDDFFEPFDSQVRDNLDDVSQRNKEKYGFDVMGDDFPLARASNLYKKWLQEDDEE